MTDTPKLHRVMTIENGEIKPSGYWREAFDRIFPETIPPVLKDYGAYVVECSRLRKDPLSKEDWAKQCEFATGVKP